MTFLSFQNHKWPTASAGGSASFVGDAIRATFNTSHTFDSATANTSGSGLPATYPAMEALLGVFSTSAVPTSGTIDGASLGTPLISYTDGTLTLTVYKVTLAGGGSAQIVINFGSSQPCAVALYDITGMTVIDTLVFSDQSTTTSFPTNRNIASSDFLTTLAGDTVITFLRSTSATIVWNQQTQSCPATTNGSRRNSAGHIYAAAGGAPETMNVTMDAANRFTTCLSVQLR